jgi:hypothetical protein
LPDQARYLLVNRFIDLIFCVLLVAGLILFLIGCRLAVRWLAIRQTKASKSNSKKLPQKGDDVVDRTGSDSTSEEGTVLEDHDHDPRGSPIVVGVGRRPKGQLMLMRKMLVTDARLASMCLISKNPHAALAKYSRQRKQNCRTHMVVFMEGSLQWLL